MSINKVPSSHIRNIAIIAHVDHGKSTLADRFIQECDGLDARDMKEQVLDSMDIERERGITIKAQSVSLNYKKDGEEYLINFIDTPGHVDFSYEVSRSLSACEGAILIVDAAQGVEAQTLATTYTAVELGVEVVPVLNKIDLPSADKESAATQIEELVGLSREDCFYVSAKKGTGVRELLDGLITRIPAPAAKEKDSLRALILDSWFDNYLGVVSLVRVVEGVIKKGDKAGIASQGTWHKVDDIGVFTPRPKSCNDLKAGEVGYLVLGVKEIKGVPVGDTVIKDNTTTALPGFRAIKPRIFAGLFPIDSGQFPHFRESLTKLSINDAALVYEPIQSAALGSGFRVGLLGLLHLDIVRERLEREYAMDLVATSPTVIYRAKLINGEEKLIEAPDDMPASGQYLHIEEPMVDITILLPNNYMGNVIELCEMRRGKQKNISYQVSSQVSLEYRLPLSELMTDFFDRLSSITKGMASMDYQLVAYEPVNLVRLDILINGESIDAMSRLVHRGEAESVGRKYVENLKEIIPRQLFAVAIQAAVGSKIIARATVTAMRKNVTAKCYGGDITRKRKLLDKQKQGKKRMKQIGKVNLPSSAFSTILSS